MTARKPNPLGTIPLVPPPPVSRGRREVLAARNRESAEALAEALPLTPRLRELRRAALTEKERSKEDRMRMAEENIFFFGRYYFPEFFPNTTPDFHWELADEALAVEKPWETGGSRFYAAAPRGHAKSTIINFLLPLYWICFKRKKVIVIISETQDFATNFVTDIKKQFEENERLRADFGEMTGDSVRPRPLKWTTSDFSVAHRNSKGKVSFKTRVVAKSTNSQFRGIKEGANRPDAIICDDLENDELVRSKVQRQQTWDWFNKTVIPALNPATGCLIVIGTILHFDSLLQRLLNLAKRQQQNGSRAYRSKLYRAIKDDGTLLWKDRFTKEFLEERREEMGTLAFNSEYLNIPIDEEARIYRPEWIQWYTANEIAYDKDTRKWLFRGEPLEIYVGVDPAISEEESADYFALVVLGVSTKSKSIVVLWSMQTRMDFPKQVQEIIGIAARWQPRMIGIEENAYQRALPQQLIRESASLPIRRLNNGGGKGSKGRKYTRILAASVYFENQQVWMRAATDSEKGEYDALGQVRVWSYQASLYDQMMQYPNSANDDLLDALENALQIAKIKGKVFDGRMF